MGARLAGGDYGVDPARIHLIPSGTKVPESVPRRSAGERLRLLFVGGQFDRKGGPVLLDALDGADFPYELHVVTKSEVEARESVTVHAAIDPGSPQLDELYARSDVFVLPTEADASPHVILEAMAARLPVISDADRRDRRDGRRHRRARARRPGGAAARGDRAPARPGAARAARRRRAARAWRSASTPAATPAR